MDLQQAASIEPSPPGYRQASVEYDEDLGIAVLNMHPHPRPCFTPALLLDIRRFQDEVSKRVRRDIASRGSSAIRYTVLASGLKGSYSHGGDLALFAELIRRGQRDTLFQYAKACVDAAHGFAFEGGPPLTSIALVEGRAEGGGFEAALSCQVIIAEKGVHMGFPEVLFNLFPGMGAYSYLSRRVSPAIAERLIYSGDIYSAEELYELGIVDHLAEPGEGRAALASFVRNSRRRQNARRLLGHVRRHYNAVPYEELLDITTLWVDAAMQLGESELRIMNRLVRAQDRKQRPDARQAG